MAGVIYELCYDYDYTLHSALSEIVSLVLSWSITFVQPRGTQMLSSRAVIKLYVPHPRNWQRQQMSRDCPGEGGMVIDTAGIDWCIRVNVKSLLPFACILTPGAGAAIFIGAFFYDTRDGLSERWTSSRMTFGEVKYFMLHMCGNKLQRKQNLLWKTVELSDEYVCISVDKSLFLRRH